MRPIQAVILAGGLGTRLRPITLSLPKPMAPVAGKPYLERQIHELARQSVRDIVLLTGYLGEQIEAHFGDGSRLGVSIRYSRENTPLGTGGALRLARSLLDERFLVIYGDSYLPIAYAGVMSALERSGATGIVVVYDNRLDDTAVKNNISLDEQGYVTRYEKDGLGLEYVEAGVLAFRRSITGMLPEGVVSLEEEVFPRLIARRELMGLTSRERFYDIGTVARLQTFERLFAQ